MTDNEIIKAFQYCFTNDFGKTNCYKCAFYTATAKCMDDMQNAVIDLINRQKAEIDSLKVDLAKCNIRLDNLYKTADEIKSKAIREFAERLKEHRYGELHNRISFSVEYLYDLVKEMTEGKNEK